MLPEKIVSFLTFYEQNDKYKYYSLKFKPQLYIKIRFSLFCISIIELFFKFSLTFLFILILLKVFGSCNGDSQTTFLWMFSLNKIEAQFVTSRILFLSLLHKKFTTHAHTRTLINTHSNLHIHNTHIRTHIRKLSQHTHTNKNLLTLFIFLSQFICFIYL